MPQKQAVRPSFSINYQHLFHSLSVPIIFVKADDPYFTILEENDAHAEVAMVNRGDVIDMPILEAFPDTSDEFKKTGKSALIESFRQVIRTKKPDLVSNIKYDIRDRDGNYTPRYWNLEHHPVIDNGKVVGIYQITADITDKLETEKKLERAQAQLDQTLTNSAIGTWLWDIKKNLVYMDKNFSYLFGLDPEEAAGGMVTRAMVTSIHPEDQKRVAQETYAALEKRAPFESEYRTFDAKGEIHWVLARGQIKLNKQGEPCRFPGVVIDITERKSAENNLNYLTQASAQFSASMDYRKTLHNIASMVVPHLADWCSIEMVNDDGKLDQVTVVHKDPKKVKWAKELRAKQGPPDLDTPTGVAKVIRTGEPEFYPVITDEMLVASAKDKKELELLRSIGFSSVIIAPMKIDGEVIGALTMVTAESRIHYKPIDLEFAIALANRATLAVYNANLYQAAQSELEERQWLQEQLETANDILESRVRERTGQLQQINEDLRKEISKRHEIEEVLQENSKNLARSNQELQDFAYVASHDLQEPLRKILAFGNLLESEYMDELGEGMDYLKRMRNAASRMSTLIEDLLAFSRVTSMVKPSVKVDLSDVLSDVISDLESRIDETNGKIKVASLPSVRADPTHMRQLFQNLISNGLKFHQEDKPPLITISSQSDDTNHVIKVKDNGIGIDKKYKEKIFNVFQRLNNSRAYEGTGIGLAVCKKIIDRYDGKIAVESQLGKGTTFIITLPVAHKGAKQYDAAT